MGDFRKRESFGRDYRRDDRRTKPTMFKAVCAECGRNCEVPFRPTGDKPVLCSHCFQNKDNSYPSNKSRNSDRNRFDRRDREEKRMFSAVCDECGKDCEVPFKPSQDKPIYCSACFETKGTKRESSEGSMNNKIYEEINLLNSKLDKILKHMENCKCKGEVSQPEKVKKTVVTKTKASSKKAVVKKIATRKTNKIEKKVTKAKTKTKK